MSESYAVVTAELASHARTLGELAADVRQVLDTASGVNLTGDAYGQISQRFVAVAEEVARAGQGALKSQVDALESATTAMRATVAEYERQETESAARLTALENGLGAGTANPAGSTSAASATALAPPATPTPPPSGASTSGPRRDTVRSPATEVAAAGSPPRPGAQSPVPNVGRPPSTWHLVPLEQATHLPTRFSTFFDSQPPEVQRQLRAEVNHAGKHPFPIWDPFTDRNAEEALKQGPPGSRVQLSADPGRPTITFRFSETGTASLYREIVVTDPNGPGVELRQAMGNLAGLNPRVPREVWVQVPDGTTTEQLNGFLNRYGRINDEGINVFFRDQSGNVLGVGTREPLR
jgi:hypothetical protein